MNKTVKLFTHTDLDGVGCAIIAYHAFGRENVDVEYCDYRNVNEIVSAYLDGEERHDDIYITDISVNEAVAERIDEESRIGGVNWRLLDHHASALWLNKYRWAYVQLYEDIVGKPSGTFLLYYDYGVSFENVPRKAVDKLDEFAETVRSYDTWDWTLTNDTAAKDLNDLLYVIGRDRFVERFTANADVNLTADERYLLDVERGRIDAYKRAKLAAVTVYEIGGRRVGITFADRYQSETGNYIAEQRSDIDLVALIDPARGVSYRSKGDVDVSEFAKLFGGGGHKNAAGSEISDEQRAAIIDIIFGGEIE